MKIIIGADIVPTKSNEHYFEEGNINYLVDNKLLKLLRNANYRIFNLEVPLTDKSTPISKCGPNLIAPCNTAYGLKKIGIDIFTLANNHIMDQNIQGLNSTIKTLDKYGINHFGTGNDLASVKHSYIIESNNLKIGLYACAEHEFSIATDKKPGANPFDPLESLDHISKLKSCCDYVIVLYHGGKEHYRYPSPNLQKICHKMIDKGACLVIAQHTHCIGCEEKYNNGTIVYGQGNFLFDAANNEFWNKSLLAELIIDKNTFIVNYIPICKDGIGVRIATNTENAEIMSEFKNRSKQILNSKFIENEYKKFAIKMKKNYLYNFCGENIIFRIADKLCNHKLNRHISQKRLLAIQNTIECEAHRELFLNSITKD